MQHGAKWLLKSQCCDDAQRTEGQALSAGASYRRMLKADSACGGNKLIPLRSQGAVIHTGLRVALAARCEGSRGLLLTALDFWMLGVIHVFAAASRASYDAGDSLALAYLRKYRSRKQV